MYFGLNLGRPEAPTHSVTLHPRERQWWVNFNISYLFVTTLYGIFLDSIIIYNITKILASFWVPFFFFFFLSSLFSCLWKVIVSARTESDSSVFLTSLYGPVIFSNLWRRQTLKKEPSNCVREDDLLCCFA